MYMYTYLKYFLLMHFSCKTTMDKLACSMEFRTIFFIILYSYVSSQPIYEIHREDRVTTTRTELYYQKAYGKPEKMLNILFHLTALCNAKNAAVLHRSNSICWLLWVYVSKVYQSHAHMVAISKYICIKMNECDLVLEFLLLKIPVCTFLSVFFLFFFL